MKLDAWRHVIDVDDFVATSRFLHVRKHVEEGVLAVHWPENSSDFRLCPERKGNGVKPIKNAFVEVLRRHGWSLEYRTFDAHYSFEDASLPPFVVEWETGNISSSHRAVNRIALGITRREILGGVLVVPTREMYQYLTDRVGNAGELERYIPLWRLWNQAREFSGGYFGIITIEHDALDATVPLIGKGTDGRALA
jgi:hypothetical protein